MKHQTIAAEEWDRITRGIIEREQAREEKRLSNHRDVLDCRNYMHLIDELTTPFEFARSLRRYRKWIGETRPYSFQMESFRAAKKLSKYADETGE